MPRRKKTGPIGGLGVRYGVVPRRRYGEILTMMRKKQACSQCGSRSIRRESVGIWFCSKCGFKFSGGAYIPETKLGVAAHRSARSN